VHRPAVLAALAVVLLLLGSEANSRADGESLGRLEQESVDEAKSRLGLTIEPRPEGRIIGTIYVVNHEVFSRRDWWFQWFNIFHRTTRPELVRRELLMKSGDRYFEPLIDESIRNLQSPPALVVAGRALSPPELSSVVAIVPVASHQPEQVDLLVVTRDVWSLRFNTDFEFQQNTLALLTTSLSENNLFGWRKFLSVGFTMDQGKMGVGPTYVDPNIAGTRLTLYASATAWYSRDTRNYEGNNETFSLRYPLFSLATRWGAGIDLTHQDTVIRSFRGNQLRLVNVALPSGATQPVPYIFRRQIAIIDSNVTRSFGLTVIRRVTFGYLFDTRRSEVMPDFPDIAAAQSFLDQFTPVSERRSEPYLGCEIFTPRYSVFRDLDTFDLRENRVLGPSLTARIAYGLPELGADFRAPGFRGTVGWAMAPAGGYGRLTAAAAARRRNGQLIDQSLGLSFYAASPLLGHLLRLIVSAQANAVRADTSRSLFFLGGSTGLRGYAIGDFQGQNQVIGHAELRSVPVAVFSQRFGGLLFYDLGHAAPSFAAMTIHHDLGVGLRWLIPQLNSSVIRIDWAAATQSTPFTRAGWPGRVTAGFRQAF
jgi:hypothetical protein